MARRARKPLDFPKAIAQNVPEQVHDQLRLISGFDGVDMEKVWWHFTRAWFQCQNENFRQARLNGDFNCHPATWAEKVSKLSEDLDKALSKPLQNTNRGAHLYAVLKSDGAWSEEDFSDLCSIANRVKLLGIKAGKTVASIKQPKGRRATPWLQEARDGLREAGVPRQEIDELFKVAGFMTSYTKPD
jgi:hypothetical protein